ncbi:MAG: hypothetical protein P8J18_00985 [Halieaceae bacterium]|nr:hypothetical protein [Halieaceae bacterium]
MADEEEKIVEADSETEETLDDQGSQVSEASEGSEAEAEESTEVNDQDSDLNNEETNSAEDITEVIMTGAEVISQLEGLIPTALDAAEASTSASEASLSTMRRLSLTQTELDGRLERNNLLFAQQSNQIKLILAAVSSVLAVAVMVFIFMIIQLSSRVSEVDALVMAVTKRVVKMNQSLELFEELQFDIRILAEKQANATLKYEGLEEVVMGASNTLVELKSDLPAATATSVSTEVSEVNKEIEQLQQTLTTQRSTVSDLSGSIKRLTNTVGAMQGKMTNLYSLENQVEALVTLTRERYLDVLEKKNDAVEDEVELEEPSDIVLYKAD